MSTQLFINAHIATGMPGSTAAETAAIQDILVEDGKFISIAPNLKATLEAQGKDMASVEVVDLGGKLVCPPFCDTHLHLDYVFTARKPGAVNESGTLFEGIQRWSETKADLTVDEIKERAKIGIAKEMRHGVQFIRSHADATDPNLTSLKALLELKEELKDTVTLQIVSFPQEGMYSYEGPHGESGADLVEEGLKMGADCVGGIPHFEQCREFGERSMHTVVELASKYDKLIDVHCDETDDPNSRYLELLSALAYRAGIGSRTTASHKNFVIKVARSMTIDNRSNALALLSLFIIPGGKIFVKAKEGELGRKTRQNFPWRKSPGNRRAKSGHSQKKGGKGRPNMLQ